MNTLEETQTLERAGFTRAQAEAIVESRYLPPSRLLAKLENAGLSRVQSEAVLDHIWAARNSILPRGPKLAGFLSGAIFSLAILGGATLWLIFTSLLQHLAK